MPESKVRKKKHHHSPSSAYEPEVHKVSEPTSTVYKAIMFSLLIIGFLWIVVFYITQSQFPIPHILYWNIAIGLGIALVGFAMMARWR